MRKTSASLMTVLILSFLAAVHFSRQSAHAAAQEQPSQTEKLDKYGGSPRLHCANKTGHFILSKIDNRWWFCDPDGNVFVAMSVGNIEPNGRARKDCNGAETFPIYISKYGDATFNWGSDTLKRMTAWGFNTVGQDSGPYVQPWSKCPKCDWPNRTQPIPLPILAESKPAEYASINQFGFLQEPIKDEIAGANNNYNAWRGGALYDVFDPKLDEWWKKALKNDKPVIQRMHDNDPYLLGILTDDSDYFWGAGAGPDFISDHTSSNVAWMTLITSPVQTYVKSTPMGGKSFLYQTTQNYSKTLATNPTSPCSIADPCSLRDYLWQKYHGKIAELNEAWHSNYTTFDSSGTNITQETIATGDGKNTVFTHTLEHSRVSPYSILLLVGGEAKAGDCPWFNRRCGFKETGHGLIGSPTPDYIAGPSSSIDYSSGAITISFTSPPPSGAAITVNYIYGGWMAGGTGLMDEDGSHKSWVGTNPFCLEGADPNYPTFFSCVGVGGGKNGKPDANPHLGADLDNWVAQMSAKYFKTMHDDLKAVTKIPYFGLDVLGSYGTPAYSKFLQGAAPYLDGAFVSLKYWQPLPRPDSFEAAYKYLTQYLGDVPFMTFSVIAAEQDSSMSCYPVSGPNNMPDQATRGEMWYKTVEYLLNTNSKNGDIQFVGANWWSWQDFQQLNQGLVSLHDNAYDGHEDVTAKVPCSAPSSQNLSCGGEATNYGDVITPVRRANALWHKFLH